MQCRANRLNGVRFNRSKRRTSSNRHSTDQNMRIPISLSLLLTLASCSSFPDSWVDPGSSEGVPQRNFNELVDHDGSVYGIQWRGAPYKRERSVWLLDSEGGLVERVLPWGFWDDMFVTAPGVVFAKGTDSGTYERFTEEGDVVAPIENCDDIFSLTSSEGKRHDYMLQAEPSRIARINPMGDSLGSVPGDKIVVENDFLYVSLDRVLVNLVDHELNSQIEGPPAQHLSNSLGYIYVLKWGGKLRVVFAHGTVSDDQFEELEPVSPAENEKVYAWIARKVGESARSLRSSTTHSLLVEDFIEVVEIGIHEDGYMGSAAKRYCMLTVRTGDENEPYLLLNMDQGDKVVARGRSTANLLAGAITELTLTRAQGAKAEYEKEKAEYDAHVAEKERVEEAKRLAQVEDARHRQRVRAIYLDALREGGFSDSTIQRNESEGVPMIVVDGEAFAGRRLETHSDIDYPNGIRWEDLPTAFTLWNAGADRWVAGLMVKDRDGIRKALTFIGGHLSARPASFLEGEFVLPISVEQSLVSCSACGGDGVETALARVQRGSYLGGDYSLELEEVKIGRALPAGRWVTNLQWSPNACPLCLGHGITPF